MDDIIKFIQDNHLCVYPSKQTFTCCDCTLCIKHWEQFKDSEESILDKDGNWLYSKFYNMELNGFNCVENGRNWK